MAIEGREDLDHSLSLGLPIVGHPENTNFGDNRVSPFLADALAAQEDARPLFTRGQIDLEAIAAARPDLIVSRFLEVEDFRQEFASIAPVLPVTFDLTWQEQSEQLAQAFGRMNQHEAYLEAYADLLERIRTDRADVLDARVVSMQFDMNGVHVGGADDFRALIIADAGGRMDPITDDVEEGTTLELSAERIDEALDGAHVAFLVVNTEDERAALDANPLWAGSQIAREGRFVVADFYSNGAGPISALGVTELVDQTYATLQA